MTLILVSFIAGILTILAPCVLPVIPVIVGGSIASRTQRWQRTIVIIASLVVSLLVFTLLLKASTSLLGVPQVVWQLISGAILVLLGLVFIFPHTWDRLGLLLGTSLRSQKLFAGASRSESVFKPVLIGAALGPVFSSCSPTYLFIVAAVLPVSFGEGLVYLTSYLIGLATVLLVVSIIGQRIVKRLGWALNPNGTFHKAIGIIFVVVGAMIIFGFDKLVLAWVLESGLYGPIEQLETSLR